MKRGIQTMLAVLLLSSTGCSQFDTIAGPFLATQGLEVYNDLLYAGTVGFNEPEIMAYDPTIKNDPGKVIFKNPFSRPIISFCFYEDAMYVATFGNSNADGRIYRVTELEADPQVELYLNVPWTPANVIIKDDILYVSRFFFFGGNFFTYDMNDPDAELEFAFDTFRNPTADVAIWGDYMIISDTEDQRIYAKDLTTSNNFIEVLVRSLDGAFGFALDENQLYVAVAHTNSNTTSRIQSYALDGVRRASFIEEFADNTTLAIADVARITGETYILERADGDLGERGYLLRVEQPITANENAPSELISTIFPNPASSYIQINGENIEHVQIADISGRLITSKKVNNNRIDISNIMNGVYVLRITHDSGKMSSHRFVKN